jgi:hypothetical protein
MWPRALRVMVAVVASLAVIGSALIEGLPAVLQASPPTDEGRAPHEQELQPSVEAAFRAESYAPRVRAKLVFFNRAPAVSVQILRIGPARARGVGDNEVRGRPVTARISIGQVAPKSHVHLWIGNWPSGVYFARLDSKDGRVGFAPFVLRPRKLGEHDVAVVMPTQTWQAYNIRDDDRNGVGDSWYADWRDDFAALHRPFLNRGVPYHFRTYDYPFLRWLVREGKDVDFLADADLDAVQSGKALARAYDLVVFPGHHEYVTENEYDVVESYRDLGGNLMFLSANNFFWKVVRRGREIERTTKWRDLGRPEAALIGVQYQWNMRASGAYVVMNTAAEPWIFAGTKMHVGSMFSHGGIEIDQVTPSSPKNVVIIARIPNVFGPGRHAHMSFYRTKAGGAVFAAGAFTMGGSCRCPDVSRILENLWTHMTRDV